MGKIQFVGKYEISFFRENRKNLFFAKGNEENNNKFISEKEIEFFMREKFAS